MVIKNLKMLTKEVSMKLGETEYDGNDLLVELGISSLCRGKVM